MSDPRLQHCRNVPERGLKQDRGDNGRFSNGRDRTYGMTYENEFYQPMPFFWTREGNTCNGLIGLYKGAVGFIICGGPSFKELDHSKLRLCWCMGLNNSPRTYRPDAWISVDDPTRFIRSIWLDPKIMKFQPFGMPEKDLWDNYTDTPLGLVVGDCPNIYYFKRNSKFHAPRWLYEDTINWGNHEDFGGCRSVMLPAVRIMFLLGFRTVYLLGADFDMSGEKTYHFNEGRDKGAVKCNLNTYRRMNEEYFPQLRPQFEKRGFNVFNCNPKSHLKAFDYVPFEDAVKHATSVLGDVSNEPTLGMYRTKEEKMKAYEERKSKQEQQNDNVSKPEPIVVNNV